MASLFGGRRRRSPEEDGEDDRSGNGRSQRRRLSPEEDAALPAEAATGSSPGWLSNFVSGAKRVLSTVMLFSSPEEPASGSEDEDDDDCEDGSGLHNHENEDIPNTIKAIVPYSESKLAIQQMVMKETFSRDEFDKMVELLKTRVTDSELPEAYDYGTPGDIPSRNVGTGHDFTGAWRSLSRGRNFPESSLRSRRFSPGSNLQTSPELCTAAVKEAKKWLEEKRKGMVLKPEDNGPCTLNTDMFSHGLDSDMGSPVDLAKSYMQSLPPWQSPFLGDQRFSTSSSGVCINHDEGPSSKVTKKEDYLSNFWANLEESRRARIGSFGGSTASRLFENDTSIFSSGTGEKVRESAQADHGSNKKAATEPLSGRPIPITPTENGKNGIVEPLEPAKDNGNAPQEYHAAPEVHPDNKVEEGNIMSRTSVAKDASTSHGGDAKEPIAEPQEGESHINSASALSLKNAGPPVQIVRNGSTNGLLDRSKANSGIESSSNGNPSCTNSSSAMRLASKSLTQSAADASEGVSVENSTGTDPEEPSKESKQTYVRRGSKRVVRGMRGRGMRGRGRGRGRGR